MSVCLSKPSDYLSVCLLGFDEQTFVKQTHATIRDKINQKISLFTWIDEGLSVGDIVEYFVQLRL